MASKLYYHDIDLQKVSILKDARINPLTTAQRTTLAATLGAGHTGLAVFDTDENKLYNWTGSAFVDGGSAVAGAVTYKGTYSNLTVGPVSPIDGDLYVLTAAGTLTWATITFSPSAVVSVGDLVIRRDATNWDVVQGNTILATETVTGDAEIATQAETNTGTDDARIVTPLKLTTFTTNKAFAKTYFASGIGLTANVAFTVTHNLALQNKDAFVISVKDSGGSEVGVDVDSVGINSLTITSGITVTNFTVTVIGF